MSELFDKVRKETPKSVDAYAEIIDTIAIYLSDPSKYVTNGEKFAKKFRKAIENYGDERVNEYREEILNRVEIQYKDVYGDLGGNNRRNGHWIVEFVREALKRK